MYSMYLLIGIAPAIGIYLVGILAILFHGYGPKRPCRWWRLVLIALFWPVVQMYTLLVRTFAKGV